MNRILSAVPTTFTEAVLREQARVERNDAIAFIFPVWWSVYPRDHQGLD